MNYDKVNVCITPTQVRNKWASWSLNCRHQCVCWARRGRVRWKSPCQTLKGQAFWRSEEGDSLPAHSWTWGSGVRAMQTSSFPHASQTRLESSGPRLSWDVEGHEGYFFFPPKESLSSFCLLTRSTVFLALSSVWSLGAELRSCYPSILQGAVLT